MLSMSLAARLHTASSSSSCVSVRESHDSEAYSSTGRTICLYVGCTLDLCGIGGNIPANKTKCTVSFVGDVVDVVFPGERQV